MAGGEVAPRETRKTVTILFADVAGSTALGEALDPETLRALMTRYFAEMRAVIEQHGGQVEKFIGDAVMAVFGVPTVHEDDALRAVRAAAEIRDRLAAVNAELKEQRGVEIQFRTGVNTGPVVSGDPTTGTSFVTGDAVNTAARLEQNAPPGEVLIGASTYGLARDAIQAEAVDPIAAKGKAQPVAAYRLVRVIPGAAGHARHLERPLIGRQNDLAALRREFDVVVAQRSARIVTVLGSAGVGKSRLVAELASMVRGEARVLNGRCLSYGDGITYWAVREIVVEAAEIVDTDTPEEARGKLARLLEDAPEAGLVARRVGSAIGLDMDPAPQEEVFWAIRKLLEHLARQRPLVAVIEDIHWAESTLLDVLDYVVDLASDVPLLLVAPARPELLEHRPGWIADARSGTVLRLEPLDPSATESLIDALTGGSDLSGDLRQRILDAAEGNPLFVEELVAMLVEDGTLVGGQGGTWRMAREAEMITVPVSIHALLAARIDRLPENERRVAERGSVVGRVFETAAVRELTDGNGDEIARSLLALVRKELLRPDRSDLTAGDAFAFRHALIRDAAYDALPKAERAALHERFGGWLVRVVGERAPEFEEIIGHHFQAAHSYLAELGQTGEHADSVARQASEHLVAAGSRALHRGDLPAATRLLEPAAALAAAPAQADAIRLDLARALASLGRFEDARRVTSDVVSSSHSRADTIVEARAVLIDLDAETEAGDPSSPSFARELDRARELATRSGDDLALANYWRIASSIDFNDDRFDVSVEALDRAVAYATRAGSPWEVHALLLMRGIDELSGPTNLAVAQAHLEQLAAVPELRLTTRAEVLERIGLAKAMRGDTVGGRVDVNEGGRIQRELGQLLLELENRRAAAWIERLADEYEAEARIQEEILDVVRQRSPGSWFGALVLSQHALALAKLGDLAGASAAIDASKTEGSTRIERIRAIAAARVLVERGRRSEALAAAMAIEVDANENPLPNARSEALVDAGVIAAKAGDNETATRRARAAIEVAQAKGNIALLRKADRLASGDLSRL